MNRLTRWLGAFASLLLTFSIAVPARATDSSCLPTPTLSSSRQVQSVQLGNGVTATAWRWYPGYDAKSAGVSQLGTKVASISGNLRKIDFGVLHWPIPQTADLRMLSYTSNSAIGSINGDFIDGNGPWNAMIDGSELIYAPTGSSSILGMTKYKINQSRGYRSTGYVKVAAKVFQVTGVNQLNPGPNSVVVYRKDYIHDVTPKGDATFVFRGSKLYKIFPKGAAVGKALGTVVQVRGALASKVKTLLAQSKVILSLAKAPVYENRMAADQINAVGTISSASATMSFDSVNYGYLSPSGATLFDDHYGETTRSGKVTLRIQPDSLGRMVVKNVYRYGYYTKVDQSGFIVQANGTAATTALKFKAGDIVTITSGYRTQNRSNFVNAGGRGARLIQNGKFVWVCDLHNKDFRPRSAIGWNEDGQVWLLTSSRGEDAIDMGLRQGGSSSDQMGHWLLQLGATEGFLLDGGGSTTMEINDPEDGWQRLDIPDSAWYRGLSNAFAILKK